MEAHGHCRGAPPKEKYCTLAAFATPALVVLAVASTMPVAVVLSCTAAMPSSVVIDDLHLLSLVTIRELIEIPVVDI